MTLPLMALLVIWLISSILSLRNNNRLVNFIFFTVFALVISATISNRDLVGDSLNYFHHFNLMCTNRVSNGNPIGYFAYNIMFCELDFKYLLLFSPFVIFMSYLSGVNYSDAILFPIYALLIFTNITFLQYGASGLKQGLSMSFLVLAINIINKPDGIRINIMAMILMVASISFHWASSVFVFLLILVYVLESKVSIKIYILIFFLSAFFSYMDVFKSVISIFNSVVGHNALKYFISEDTDYEVGFKISFIAYTLLPIFCYYLVRNRTTINDDFLIKVYLMFAVFSNVMNFIPFSDRLYGYCWFLQPIIFLNILKALLKSNSRQEYQYLIVVFFFALMLINYNVTKDFNFKFIPSAYFL